MGVSLNGGTPKSSILIGLSIINHPFWGIPIFGNTHMGFFDGISHDGSCFDGVERVPFVCICVGWLCCFLFLLGLHCCFGNFSTKTNINIVNRLNF